MATLKAPFPWFGGKSRAAHLIWERFGNVPNYVEPFAGSLAVLLARPHAPKIETVNDKDAFIANFWRAVQADPERVAHHADWPVSEIDVYSRNKFLIKEKDQLATRLLDNPRFFDAEIAGWWVWGVSNWIGNKYGECDYLRMAMSRAGNGINQYRIAGTITDMLQELKARLYNVRVMCGDWLRVLGMTPTIKQGLTAILLDPPYAEYEDVYSSKTSISQSVSQWAIENGDNPMLRIALCGYDGEHSMPNTWACIQWKATGGHSNRNADNQNAHRERIWFSPHCLQPDEQPTLFDLIEDAA